MDKTFSHLIWLGAGTASYPEQLLNLAEAATLVEARENACVQLQYKVQENAKVYNSLITADNNSIIFNEYNLADYSGINKPTKLNELFPGLRTIKSDTRQSVSVVSFINDLNLQDNNNALVIDIIDINISLLKSLQEAGLLHLFKNIQIQAGLISLYDNSATSREINNFMQENGYFLHTTITNDPDFPWLSFNLNPLWEALTQKEAEILCLSENSIETALKLSEAHSNLAAQEKKHREEIDELSQRLEEALSKAEKISLSDQYNRDLANETTLKLREFENTQASLHQDHQKEIKEVSEKFAQTQKQLKARLERISQLEKHNDKLENENKKQAIQVRLMKDEMLKAEAQINIIKELLIKQ